MPEQAKDGSLQRALGVTKDTLPLASSIARTGFAMAKGATAFGFTIGEKVLGVASKGTAAAAVGMACAGIASAEVVGAVVVGAAALKLAEIGVTAAGTVADAALTASRSLTVQAIDATDHILGEYGVPNGVGVKLAFGNDTGEALLCVKQVCDEVGIAMPEGMGLRDLSEAAQAMAWLQHAAGTACPPLPPPPPTTMPPRQAPATAPPKSHAHAPAPAPAPARGGGPPTEARMDWYATRRYMRFALAAYGHLGLRAQGVIPLIGGPADNNAAIQYLTGVTSQAVLQADWTGSTFRPGYLLLLDHEAKSVVLSVRGTMRVHDVLTDLVCEPVPVNLAEHRERTNSSGGSKSGRASSSSEQAAGSSLEGEAHGGMFEAATRFRSEVGAQIQTALKQHPGYTLTLTGHSLGAGLAMLVAALIGPTVTIDKNGPASSETDERAAAAAAAAANNTAGAAPAISSVDNASAPDVRQVRCYAYAPPCVLTLELARSLSSYVTSVIVADDMVPRFGISTTIEVKTSLATLHNEPGLVKRIHARRGGGGGGSGGASSGGGASSRGSVGCDDDGDVDGDDKAWAGSILTWVYNKCSPSHSKLFPAGFVVHLPNRKVGTSVDAERGCGRDGGGSGGGGRVGGDHSGLSDASFSVGVDNGAFNHIVLSGTSMWASHLPGSYSSALLGDLHAPYSLTEAASLEVDQINN